MQNHEANRVLVIDDDPDIHEHFRGILGAHVARVEPEVPGAGATGQASPRFEVDCAQQGEHGLGMLKRAIEAGPAYSVAFVDARMPPGWDGIQTIGHLWKADPALEVVICTAAPDFSAEEIGGQLPRLNQFLVLKKPFESIEVRQLAVALSEKWRLARAARLTFDSLEALVKARTGELERSHALIQASENQYRLLFDSNPIPIFTYDESSLAFLSVNEAAVRLYGYGRDEFLAMSLRDLAQPEDVAAFLDSLTKPAPGAGHCRVWRHRTKNGKFIELEITSHYIVSRKMYLSLAIDVTERQSLEAQLRQAQKMESIGQLAGGIAHDFNNLLTVINGHSSLLAASEKLSPKGADSLKEIVEAGKQAGALTRQLMTFSRKQEFHPQVVDLNEVVNAVTKMLKRILGEDVTLHVDLSPGLPSIKADLGMIEQVLMNLAVNSRDAMPRGGQLRIKTSATNIDSAAAQHNAEAAPGRYVCLSFGDTGCGITAENLGRIFEPFFTTKQLGRGTGLGLATVYGIIKQHQGWITVRSLPDQGTTFHIFVPASDARSGPLQMMPAEQNVIGGTETILVVEDEAPLLKLMLHVLETHGYKTHGCSNGRQALEVWREHRERIDMVLTDLILPDGMGGTVLAGILKQSKPALKVLYTSGYNAERLAKEFPPGVPVNLIQKPFHARKLVERVFETLKAKA